MDDDFIRNSNLFGTKSVQSKPFMYRNLRLKSTSLILLINLYPAIKPLFVEWIQRGTQQQYRTDRYIRRNRLKGTRNELRLVSRNFWE